MSFDETLARISAQEARLHATLLSEPDFRREFTELLRGIFDLGLDVRVTVHRREPKGEARDIRRAGDRRTMNCRPEKEGDSRWKNALSLRPSRHVYVRRPRLDAPQVDVCMRHSANWPICIGATGTR